MAQRNDGEESSRELGRDSWHDEEQAQAVLGFRGERRPSRTAESLMSDDSYVSTSVTSSVHLPVPARVTARCRSDVVGLSQESTGTGRKPRTRSETTGLSQLLQPSVPLHVTPHDMADDSDDDDDDECDDYDVVVDNDGKSVDSVLLKAQKSMERHRQQQRRLPSLEEPPPPPPCPAPSKSLKISGDELLNLPPRSRRFPGSAGRERRPDFEEAILVEKASSSSSPISLVDHQILVCSTCVKHVFVRKSTIVYECPNCHTLSPASSTLRTFSSSASSPSIAS